MDNHNILPYILGFLGYGRRYAEVSKFWNEMYINAIKNYDIEIIFVKTITDEKFTEIMSLPRFSSIYKSTREIDIKVLCLHECKNIKLNNVFTRLKKLDIYRCNNITKIPESLVNTLEELDLTTFRIDVIPSFTKLKRLRIYQCYHITKIPESLVNTLKILSIVDNYDINIIPSFTKLEKLDIHRCIITKIPESLVNTLEILNISKCDSIGTIPSFTKLKGLNIYECYYITKIPESLVDTLEELKLDTSEIDTIPSFTRLKILHLKRCLKITIIPEFNIVQELVCINCGVRQIPLSICRTVIRDIITG